jgi:hypothetical protein
VESTQDVSAVVNQGCIDDRGCRLLLLWFIGLGALGCGARY